MALRTMMVYVLDLDYQHFNTDMENPCRLIGACPNLFDLPGVDLGTGFEQQEPCPEYRAENGK